MPRSGHLPGHGLLRCAARRTVSGCPVLVLHRTSPLPLAGRVHDLLATAAARFIGTHGQAGEDGPTCVPDGEACGYTHHAKSCVSRPNYDNNIKSYPDRTPEPPQPLTGTIYARRALQHLRQWLPGFRDRQRVPVHQTRRLRAPGFGSYGCDGARKSTSTPKASSFTPQKGGVAKAQRLRAGCPPPQLRAGCRRPLAAIAPPPLIPRALAVRACGCRKTVGQARHARLSAGRSTHPI